MAWSFIAASAVANGANPVVVTPATSAGDVMVICGASQGNFSALAGWNEVILNNAPPRLSVWWKIAAGSDGNVSLTNADNSSVAVMVVYRGLFSAPFDTNSVKKSGGGTTIATNTLNTANPNELVISLYAMDNATAANWTGLPISGTSTRVTKNNTGGSKGMLIVDENQATPGVSTARTATVDISVLYKSAISIAFSEVAVDRGRGLFFGSTF